MKPIVILLATLGLTVVARAADTPPAAPRFADSPVNAPTTQQQYKLLSNRLITEFLETGKLSRDSTEAYQLMLGISSRNGVRLEKVPIRTIDERNLGAALIVARLETLGFGYDRIYRLKLQNQ